MSAWGTAWGGAWGNSWGALEVAVAPPISVIPAGGTSKRIKSLPQYYSRQIYGSGKIQLPQEAKAHEVALEVLNDASDLQTRLNEDDGAFKEMLEIVEHLLKQVATYIESQQIYRVVTDIELRIRAKMDAQRIEAQEDEEFEELLVLL